MAPTRRALGLAVLALSLLGSRAAAGPDARSFRPDANGDLERRLPLDGARRHASEPPREAQRPKGGFQLGLDGRHGYDADTYLATGIDNTEMRALLESLGAVLVTLVSFEAADLQGLDALFIAQPYTQNDGDGYTASEIAAIQAFVQQGGSLLVHAEGGSGGDELMANLNELVAPWGVAFAASPSLASGHVVRDFLPHPLTTGITEFGVDYIRPLVTLGPPAVDITSGTGPDDVIAALDSADGAGCVVFLGDMSCWHGATGGSDYPITALDNQAMLENVTRHFMSAECSSVAPCVAVAALTGPAELCEGEAFTLDASGSAVPGCPEALEYRWLRDGAEVEPWSDAATLGQVAELDATYGVEVRCPSDPGCVDEAEHPLLVVPDEPPPALPNLLLAFKQPDAILFTWEDTGVFEHHLRRHSDPRFDRASSALVGAVQDVELLVPGELTRPPDLIFYLVFGANCAGTEEL